MQIKSPTILPLFLLSLSFFFLKQECTAVETNVYCYGGYSSVSGSVFTNDNNDHIFFDLSKTDTTKATTSPTWTVIAPPNSITLDRRSAFEITTMGHGYIVLGDSHSGNNLSSPASMYDTTANAWTYSYSLPTYMSEGAMVAVSNWTAYVYGGKLWGHKQITRNKKPWN
ncbi:hypothetical protein BC941DRAFT_55961 [Chlamydoabsidia padenii]|nr:hypothetical protein BC941DRAFT_55961 [Chlamydoabsidia padenii]